MTPMYLSLFRFYVVVNGDSATASVYQTKPTWEVFLAGPPHIMNTPAFEKIENSMSYFKRITRLVSHSLGVVSSHILSACALTVDIVLMVTPKNSEFIFGRQMLTHPVRDDLKRAVSIDNISIKYHSRASQRALSS